MAHTCEELKQKPLAELREIAKDLTQETVQDRKALKTAMDRIHHLKRRMRKAMV